MNPSKFSLNRRARDYWDSDRGFWNGQWESHKKTAARIVTSRVLPGRQPAAGWRQLLAKHRRQREIL
jgi:hypothetical protein